MQMHQIRYFLALCDERSFTRAAKRNGVTQPSMTNAILVLEEELGGELFRRRPRVSLTALGHLVYPYLKEIAENADRALAAARALTDMSTTRSEAVAVSQPAIPS
jgi:DNA-binding transcriptional LysR family regulator